MFIIYVRLAIFLGILPYFVALAVSISQTTISRHFMDILVLMSCLAGVFLIGYGIVNIILYFRGSSSVRTSIIKALSLILLGLFFCTSIHNFAGGLTGGCNMYGECSSF